MFESLRGFPADGAGCSGLDLVFQAGLEHDRAFVAKAVDHFRRLRDVSGLPLRSLAGLGDEVEQLHSTYVLLHGKPGGMAEMALFAAALSASLIRRFAGEDPPLSFESTPRQARLAFEPGGGFVHSFALLYSASFLHHVWREGAVEPRLNQLLEVAELFFAGYAGEGEPGDLQALERQFPQEILNSFVNLVHPHPQHIGNLLTKILLLEDNRELGEIIADMLSSYSYVVCQAADGISGLGRLERERFQLIVSDIQMPRLNGIGLLKVMRNLHMDVPVILTTGFTGIWQEEQALQQGAVAFLPKPFGMAELIRTVDRVLTGQAAVHSH
jgi:CheY-like chemotaxis protein